MIKIILGLLTALSIFATSFLVVSIKILITNPDESHIVYLFGLCLICLVCHIVNIINILRSIKQQKLVKNFKNWANVEIFVGLFITGIFLLSLKDKDFKKDKESNEKC